MTIAQVIRDRRAQRDYLDQPVTPATIDALIATAVWAPSGMNAQPWRFIVVDDRATLTQWAELAKAHLAADAATPAALRPALADPAFNIFYNAPVLVVICATTPDPMAKIDCCLAAQTFMLAAHEAGLATCWIGLAQPWLDSPAGRERLGFGDEAHPVAPLLLGWPAERPPAPDRRPARIDYVVNPQA